jgi:oligopeptide/dipeptide ABC transporter ATP-binding protein
MREGKGDSAGDSLIAVRDLAVRYAAGASSRRALSGVSLEVRTGEVVGILGESGSGKTTLALSLLRMLPPWGHIENGTIRFRHRDLMALKERELTKIRGAEVAMIFQEPELALNPFLSALRHVEEVLAAHRPWSRRKRREESRRVLAAVGLGGEPRLLSSYPHQLSGGERQRLVMAVALACGPALVVADEPTAALDAILQAEWLASMKRLRSELQTALLLITHDPAILAGWADRVLILHAGRVVEQGGFEEVIRGPLHPYTQALLHSIPPHPGAKAAPRKRLPDIVGPSILQTSGEGCPFAPRCPDRLPVCTRSEPPEVAAGSRRVRCFKYVE